MNVISKYPKILLYLSSAILVFSILMVAFLGSPNADSYYYIGVSKLILEGKVPFVDFNLAYTPLSFYLMAPFVKLFGSSFICMLGCLYVIHGLNAYMIYNLLKKYTIKHIYSIFAVVYYLLSCFFLNGKAYILEPFVTFWGLLALILLCKDKLIYIVFAGMCGFCSYCSKQYGVGYVCLSVLYLIFYSKNNKLAIKNVLLLLLGFALAALVFYSFLYSQGLSFFRENTSTLQGGNYAKDGIFCMMRSYITLILNVPALIVAVYIYIKEFKNLKGEYYLHVFLCGIIGFMLSTYVRGYWHYLQLALPFAVLFSFSIISGNHSVKIKPLYKKILYSSIIAPCILATIVSCRLYTKEFKIKAENNAEKIARAVPVNSEKVYVCAYLLNVAYINNYMPPMLKEYGMSNGFVESDEGTCNLIKDANYSIIETKRLKMLKMAYSEMKDYIEANFVDVSYIVGNPKPSYTLLKRKGMQ